MNFSISVLISTYNSRRYVKKKLEEIVAQTLFSRAEFIFIETASPEKERELITPFCEAYSNCKLIVDDQRKTLYEAWNIGWDAASAPILCYSNMDDCMHPRLLEYVVDAMSRDSWKACSVLIAKQIGDEYCNDWSPQRLRCLPLSLRPGPFLAWHRDLNLTIGQFDGRFYTLGDKDFWSRLVVNRIKIGLVKKILYLYVKNTGQLSKIAITDDRRIQDEALRRQKPYPMTWSATMKRSILFIRAILPLFHTYYTVEYH